jgi:hypothetical protein
MSLHGDQSRDALPDGYLVAALRHAPDAHLQPPPALDNIILRAARAKQRASLADGDGTVDVNPAASLGPWVQRVRVWWRAPWPVPALGAVGLALLTAMLWRSEEVSVPQGGAEIHASAPQAVDKTMPAPTAVSSAAPTAPQTAAATAAPTAPVATSAGPTDTPNKLTPKPSTTERTARETKHRDASDDAALVARASVASATAAASAIATAPAAAPTLQPAPTVAEAVSSATAAPPVAAATAPSVAADTMLSASPPASGVAQGVSRARVASSAMADRASADTALRASTPAPTLAPTPALLAPMTGAPDDGAGSGWGLSWASHHQPPQSVPDGRVRAWARALSAATHGRWHADAGSEAIEPAAVRVSISRQQTVVATVVVGSTVVTWIDADARRWHASVGTEQAQVLAAMLR